MKRVRIVKQDKARDRGDEQHLKQGEQDLHLDRWQVISKPAPPSRNWFQRFWKWLGFDKKAGIDIIGGFLILLCVSLGVPIVTNYVTEQRYYDSLLGQYINSMEELLIKDKLHTKYIEKVYLEQEIKFLKNPPQQPKEIEKFIGLLGNEERIRYFNELSKKPESLEKVNQALIHELEIEKEKKEAEYKQVRSLALSLTENMLRTFSKDDALLGIHIPREIKKPWNNQETLIRWAHYSIYWDHIFSWTRHNPYRRQLLLNYLRQSELGFKPRNSDGQGKCPSQFLQASCQFLQSLDLGSAKGGEEGPNLEEIILDKAILKEANFTKTNLTGARFVEADLEGARFEAATLKGASLMQANLEGANLRKAQLKDADLKGAILTGADLRETNLQDAKYDEKTNVKGACYDNKTVFPDPEFQSKNSHSMRKLSDNQVCK